MTPNPLAYERFRTLVADAIAWAATSGAPASEAVVADFPHAHFEYQTNSAGVRVRRVAVASEWESDPDNVPQRRTPAPGSCVDPMGTS